MIAQRFLAAISVAAGVGIAPAPLQADATRAEVQNFIDEANTRAFDLSVKGSRAECWYVRRANLRHAHLAVQHVRECLRGHARVRDTTNQMQWREILP